MCEHTCSAWQSRISGHNAVMLWLDWQHAVDDEAHTSLRLMRAATRQSVVATGCVHNQVTQFPLLCTCFPPLQASSDYCTLGGRFTAQDHRGHQLSTIEGRWSARVQQTIVLPLCILHGAAQG
jgi:hypothetical protein